MLTAHSTCISCVTQKLHSCLRLLTDRQAACWYDLHVSTTQQCVADAGADIALAVTAYRCAVPALWETLALDPEFPGCWLPTPSCMEAKALMPGSSAPASLHQTAGTPMHALKPITLVSFPVTRYHFAHGQGQFSGFWKRTSSCVKPKAAMVFCTSSRAPRISALSWEGRQKMWASSCSGAGCHSQVEGSEIIVSGFRIQGRENGDACIHLQPSRLQSPGDRVHCFSLFIFKLQHLGEAAATKEALHGVDSNPYVSSETSSDCSPPP